MGDVHRIRVVRERPRPLLLLALAARPPQLLPGRPDGRAADALELAGDVPREARRAEARHHVRARRRAAPPRLRGLLDDAPHELAQVLEPGLPRYAVRTQRPRLVRVPRTYSTWGPGGEPPCASGTYQRGRLVRVARTYPTEAPGRTCQRRLERGLGPAVAGLVERVGQRGELVVERVARLLAQEGGGARPAQRRGAARRGAARSGEVGRAVRMQVRARARAWGGLCARGLGG